MAATGGLFVGRKERNRNLIGTLCRLASPIHLPVCVGWPPFHPSIHPLVVDGSIRWCCCAHPPSWLTNTSKRLLARLCVHVGQPRHLISLPSLPPPPPPPPSDLSSCSSGGASHLLQLLLIPSFSGGAGAACPRRRRSQGASLGAWPGVIDRAWSGRRQLAEPLGEGESGDPCMDGKDLISPSDLPPFYGQQQQHLRMLGGTGGGGGQHSPSSLAGMHSVIRPMPNMSMSPTAILQSIGGAGGSLAAMQFNMDSAPSPSSMLQQNSMGGSVSGSGGTMPVASPPPEPVKRKRGRPRKYGPDGTMKHHMSSSSSSAHHQQQQHQMMGAPQQRMGSMSGQGMAGGLDDAAQKKKRGRPPGTGKKLSSPTSKPSRNAFPGSAGTSFTPHIITASPSEDVAGKIAAFASQSPRAVCVLSAMGSISRAVLRQPADHPPSYNNPAIYEGLYEILSLSGSYNLNEGQQNQTDGISVTLCSPERHVIGGVLGGALVAASTVQVVLGTFLQGGSKSKSKKAVKLPAAFGPDSLTGAGPDVASPSSGHNQNLTPPSVVSTGGWPSSGIFDTRSSNIDINSSRG